MGTLTFNGNENGNENFNVNGDGNVNNHNGDGNGNFAYLHKKKCATGNSKQPIAHFVCYVVESVLQSDYHLITTKTYNH